MYRLPQMLQTLFRAIYFSAEVGIFSMLVEDILPVTVINNNYQLLFNGNFNSLSSSSVCFCKCSSSIDFFENFKLHMKHSLSEKQQTIENRQFVHFQCKFNVLLLYLTTNISLDWFIACCCNYCKALVLGICTTGMNINWNSQQ